MALLAITVLGDDSPGIVARTTALLADLGGNIEDTTMTLLRGHFAMVLVVRLEVPLDAVEAALAPLSADGGLDVAVRTVSEAHQAQAREEGEGGSGSAHLLSVHGGDRPGIVSALLAPLSAAGGNVTDLTTRLSGDLYVLLAEVDLPDGTDVGALQQQIGVVASALDVDASLRPLEADLL